MENTVKSKVINEIQIFLHLIYPKLIEILKSIPKIETPIIRKDLEKRITDLVDEYLKIYNTKKEEYMIYNNKYTKCNIGSMKSISQELFSIPQCRNRCECMTTYSRLHIELVKTILATFQPAA